MQTWEYCHRTVLGREDAQLLLWRGVEMVELLSTLSMDKDSMRAALLFPLAEEDLINQEVITEHFGEAIWNLVRGVMEMDAIRQLKATHTNETSSVQVDNVRRMLLSMVEDFRCVVIKLAERIAHLREVKDATVIFILMNISKLQIYCMNVVLIANSILIISSVRCVVICSKRILKSISTDVPSTSIVFGEK